MAIQVCNGATLMCAFGMTPSVFVVLPANKVLTSSQPAANIKDHIPMINIMPFGMCTTPSNPQVASATAAAMGVLTPQPCIPMTTSPWSPGSLTVMLGSMLALNNTSILMCSYGGVITVTDPGQQTEMIA